MDFNAFEKKAESPLNGTPGPFRASACPLCRRSASTILYFSVDYNHKIPGRFRYVQCRHCGLVYENPRPVPGNLMALYPERYGNPGCLTQQDLESKIDSAVIRKRAALVDSHGSGGTLFDIGCGSGFFLAYMQRRGWGVSGIEPAAEHVRFAQNRLGIKSITQAQWPEGAGVDSPVQVVTLFHVIEHLLDPVKSIEKTREILMPGGLLVVETPNVGSLPAKLFGKRWVTLDAPRHVNLFSADTLRQCIHRAGFDTLELVTFSPSVMEYTESLRYLISDLGIRRYSRKPGTFERNCSATVSAEHLPRKAMKGWLHTIEARFFENINILADGLNHGCNLLLAARKKSTPNS